MVDAVRCVSIVAGTHRVYHRHLTSTESKYETKGAIVAYPIRWQGQHMLTASLALRLKRQACRRAQAHHSYEEFWWQANHLADLLVPKRNH